MQTIVMATVEEVTEETTAQTEAEEETETDVIETDSSLEFEYDGKKIVISADKPVELIPEEDLADKIIEDDELGRLLIRVNSRARSLVFRTKSDAVYVSVPSVL